MAELAENGIAMLIGLGIAIVALVDLDRRWRRR
jgi:hypothetical protein